MRSKETESKMSVQFGGAIICLLAASFGVSAQTIIYVDRDNVSPPADGTIPDGASWATAYPDLQSALADAAGLMPAPEIWIAEGEYSPGASRANTFQLLSGVALYGGFNGTETTRDLRDPEANVTTLTGDAASDDHLGNRGDNNFHVISGFSLSTETILDGLTITAGNANGGATVEKLGGGLSIGASILTVRNCIFIDNDAEPGDGVGGGAFASNGQFKFIGCLFEDNFAARGGGLSFIAGSAGSLLLEGCTFTNNSAIIGGGGIEIGISISTDVVIQNCIIEGNSATLDDSEGGAGGGLRGLSNGMVVVNCLFVGNFAAQCGGAIQTTLDSFSSLPAPLVVNSTITENITGSSGIGGGICLFPADGRLTVVNTILWNNTDPGGRNESAQIDFSKVTKPGVPIPDVSFSLIDGLVSGGDFNTTNNTGMDPLFVMASTGDFTLAAGSPAIDTGNNFALLAGIPDPDLNGNLRVTGDAVDMGAFESTGIVDSDGDGVNDADDACPDSDLSETIVIGGNDTGVENDLLGDGCTIADLINDILADDPSTADIVQFLVDLKAEGVITGRDLGAILKTLNSP